MNMNLGLKGQERYKQSVRSVEKKSQAESLGSFRASSQFGLTGVSEPKKVTVIKPASSDTKLEGFSVSKGKMGEGNVVVPSGKPIEDEFINNLQQQIYFTELEIKLMKDQENARANKFMGGLEAGPLTENLVMLKGKYKTIQDELQAKIDELTHENRELAGKNNTAKINYSRFLEEIKDIGVRISLERESFDKESERYRKAISNSSFFKEENAKILTDTTKARDLAKAYTGETRIKIERQASLLSSLEEKLNQAEIFKTKVIDEKNKQILNLKDKLLQLQEDVKNNSTLGMYQEKLTFLNANKQEVEMERDNLVNRIKTLKQSKQMIEKAAQQLQIEKRALINQVEECKLEIDRTKSQQELILGQKLRQKEKREINTNTSLLEDSRMENENLMVLLKNLIAENTELSEDRTKCYYDIEEIKEKKSVLEKEFQILKGSCITLEGDYKDMTSKIRVMEDRSKEVVADIEGRIVHMRQMNEENQDLKGKLEFLKKKVEINEQLKNIDLEELKMLAKSNLVMNNTINDLISKWEGLQEKRGK